MDEKVSSLPYRVFFQRVSVVKEKVNPLRGLAFLLQSPSEREYRKLCRARPVWSDEEFAEECFGAGALPAEIPVRARRVVARALGADKVIGSDNLAAIFPHMDLAELIEQVQDEFDIQFEIEEFRRLDGTFANIVQAVARKLGVLDFAPRPLEPCTG
ncbi:MAG TPA: hypothetical protein VFE24_18360 [Pirellulales bacterium]|nr:hypothetical protein [Pirellulales bacterium]